MDEAIGSVVLLIGLAVGVDYSMFYLRREREERAHGLEGRAALAVAAATSGRAVLVSGMTVVIAMAGMFLGGSRIWTAFAIGNDPGGRGRRDRLVDGTAGDAGLARRPRREGTRADPRAAQARAVATRAPGAS